MNATQTQRVEGFNKIISAPNECMFTFARRGADYRGPMAGHWTNEWWTPRIWEKNEIVWETAICPQKQDTIFSFVAAASMTPPQFAQHPQARIYVGDEYGLCFDIGIIRDRTWQDGEFELRYVSKNVQWPYDIHDRRFEMTGNSGLYQLSVPARLIEAGQPCRIKVEVLPFPRWPRTWFMIKERRDTLSANHLQDEVSQLREEVNNLKQLVHILATNQYCDLHGREMMQHRVVYTSEYQHLLSPDLAKLKNGDWLLCVRIGAEHVSLDGDVILLCSRDEGETWEKLSTPASTPDLDEREGGLVELPDGRLLMNIFINRMYDENANYLDTATLDQGLLTMYTILSSDGGVTWTEPIYLDLTGLPFTDIEGPASPPIVLPDGTVLQALTAYNVHGNVKASATVIFSSREGDKWELCAMVAIDEDGKRGGFWEPSIVRGDSGRILCAMRNEGGSALTSPTEDGRGWSDAMHNEGAPQAIWTAWSEDDGHTWSVARPTPMIGHPPDLIRLQDGAILCTYGYRPENHGEPAGVRAMISYDEGESWDEQNEIIIRQDFTNFDIGYPASLQRRDGKVVSVYYYNLFGRFFVGSTTWQLPTRGEKC